MGIDPNITSIGHYRVLRELGRGGMGVVYLAEDPRLGREVAIKALPEEVAEDPTRLDRFEREARVLAQLNHPNVAGIYGVEEQDGARYLVLEYVKGETLADALDRGPLPVDEVINLAVQIASGVEAAHEAGVIHRDLKPGNIVITPDGKAKVLDFGLARQSEEQSSSNHSEAATLTSPAIHTPTTPGVILGTAAYMSPEQARGRRVDKRTDIWSFGVILYEMLCGYSPFRGESVTDSIGAILHKDVDLTRLPNGVPASARRVLHRSLQRDKNKRYRDIGDAWIELLHGSRDEPAVPAAEQGVPLIGALGLSALVAAAAIGTTVLLLQKPEAPKPVRKYTVASLGPDEVADGFQQNWLAISPDGKRIAYIVDRVIQVRDMDSFEQRALSETEGAEGLFWSPSSDALGYYRDSSLYRIGIEGGGTIRLCEIPEDGKGMPIAWTESGKIIFSAGEDGLLQVGDRGGEPTPFLARNPELEIDFHGCSVIPNSDALLIVRHPIDGPFTIIASDGTTSTELISMRSDLLSNPIYSRSGHIVFQRGMFTGEIWAAPFDAKKLRVIGDPFLVSTGGLMPTVSSDGTLVFAQGDLSGGGTIASFAPVGAELDDQSAAVEEILAVPGSVFGPIISPDGTRVAYGRGEPPDVEPWVISLVRGSQFPIAELEPGEAAMPLSWSPDGTEIACQVFSFRRGGTGQIAFFAADGSGTSRVRIADGFAAIEPSWKTALVQGKNEEGETGLFLHDLDARDEPVLTEIVLEFSGRPAIDPRGELLAYASSRTGESQVYVTRYPSGKGRWPVSVGGGTGPVWAPDGSALFFEENGDVFRVSVSRDETLSFGTPELYLDTNAVGAELTFAWSVSPEDGRIIATTSPTEEGGQDPKVAIRVVENWAEEFADRSGR
ncbi:MAG: protein kinase [Planctomycetota bacterium]